MKNKISLLAGLSMTLAAFLGCSSLQDRTSNPGESNKGIAALDAIRVRLLTGSPFYDRQELHRHGYLASFEPDRLLFHYRALAKLPQAEGAKAYGGWDSGFIRGHMAGHYLSAASRIAAETGDKQHLDAAQLFNREWFKGPQARGEDHLAGIHGNTHIAQAIGLARCANITGDPEEIKASENFWRIVTRDHSFVIGGNTFSEWFHKPGVEVGPSIFEQKSLPPKTAESCNTHNLLKLTARLFERHSGKQMDCLGLRHSLDVDCGSVAMIDRTHHCDTRYVF